MKLGLIVLTMSAFFFGFACTKIPSQVEIHAKQDFEEIDESWRFIMSHCTPKNREGRDENSEPISARLIRDDKSGNYYFQWRKTARAPFGWHKEDIFHAELTHLSLIEGVGEVQFQSVESVSDRETLGLTVNVSRGLAPFGSATETLNTFGLIVEHTAPNHYFLHWLGQDRPHEVYECTSRFSAVSESLIWELPRHSWVR